MNAAADSLSRDGEVPSRLQDHSVPVAELGPEPVSSATAALLTRCLRSCLQSQRLGEKAKQSTVSACAGLTGEAGPFSARERVAASRGKPGRALVTPPHI